MENVIKLLEKHNQTVLCDHIKSHTLDNFDNSNINNLDNFLTKINRKKNSKEKKKEEYIYRPPNFIDINSIYECKNPENGSIFTNMYKKERLCNELKHLGLEAIKKNQVAVLFLAGGLGSRLGLKKVKGLMKVTPLLNKTFFQYFFEQIRFLESYSSFVDKTETSNKPENEKNDYHNINLEKHNELKKENIKKNESNVEECNDNNMLINSVNNKMEKSEKPTIYIYIMTSNYTHDITVKYLEENQFFGLRKEHIFIFKQCDNYATDLDYNILLSGPNKLLTIPSGNGDIYRSMDKSGVIEDIRNKNIKYIQILSIDNILNKVADPVFIGFSSFFKCDIANKSVKKRENESMGVFCLREKRDKNVIQGEGEKSGKGSDKIPTNQRNDFKVCEYIELSDHILNNSKLFEQGNICNHVFSCEFLYYIIKNKIYNEMKLHKFSRKKEYYDIFLKNKKMNLLNNSNVYCYEYFLFDIFKYAKKILSFEVSRDKEFSPIKTSFSHDSILEAKKCLSNLHKSWLINKNFNIIDNQDKTLDFCEISPLVSYDGSFFFHLPNQKSFSLPYTLNHNYQ